MLKLTDLQTLSRLIYKERESDLYKWLNKNRINHYSIFNVLGNDRAIFFVDPLDLIIYVAVAGTDDREDWRENIIIRTAKKLYYGYLGFAMPADTLKKKLFKWMSDNNYMGYQIIEIGHSRGCAIAQNLFRQLWECYNRTELHGWGFGGPGGGGRRFVRDVTTDRFTKFEIKGDIVPCINPFAKNIGVVEKLPKQVKGFWHRLKLLFKGDMNHRSYDCIEKIYPWCDMLADGSILDGEK